MKKEQTNYPEWLREAASKGGQKSRRKLTKAQAQAMVRARTAKRAAMRGNKAATP